jgi:hypothetical protein
MSLSFHPSACAENETASTAHVNKVVLTAIADLSRMNDQWSAQNYFVIFRTKNKSHDEQPAKRGVTSFDQRSDYGISNTA